MNVDKHSKVPMASLPWPTIGNAEQRKNTNKGSTWFEQRTKNVFNISSGAVYRTRLLSRMGDLICLITCKTFDTIWSHRRSDLLSQDESSCRSLYTSTGQSTLVSVRVIRVCWLLLSELPDIFPTQCRSGVSGSIDSRCTASTLWRSRHWPSCCSMFRPSWSMGTTNDCPDYCRTIDDGGDLSDHPSCDR